MSFINRIMYCKDHNIYFLPKRRKRHEKCLETWELEWDEVIFYLNKAKGLRDITEKLRIELGW